MSARFLTTLSPAPAGFAPAVLSKRELLSGCVVLLAHDLDELAGAVSGFADRVQGFVVVPSDAFRWRQLGPALWHLTLPTTELDRAADLCTCLVAVLEDGVAAVERALERDIGLARTRADLASTRHDYNESVARLVDRMAEVVTLNENLRESEERFRALVETSSDWIWETDDADVYTYSSPRSLGLLGYDPAEVVGRRPFEFAPPQDADPSWAAHAECVRERRPISGLEKVVCHRDGRLVIVETSAVPIVDAQGSFRGYRGIDRDITGRKCAEDERLHLERRVLHAQKLESLGVLAGGIAHDFNNLLVAILGNAELAMLAMSPSAPGRDAVQDVRQAALRASELTNQMLAYSGKGRFVVESIDLGTMVRETARLLEVSVCKGAHLQYELTDRLPAVDADAAQLRQVVMNLVTNASEAIEGREGDGVIILRTSLVHVGQDGVPGAAPSEDLPAGVYVALDVVDTGCGMTDEVKARIFDPFFTTKFQGRGLGLAAVQGIVRGHGGTLTIESEPGRGTCIRVLLPIGSRKAGLAPATTPTSSRLLQGSGTVLVIDDDGAVRMIASRILERMGFSVLTAENGAVGLDLFRARMHEITFVLLDLTMPVMGGEQAFAELRRLRGDVRVILASGYNEQDATSRFAGAGLAGFIKKPFTIEGLGAVIRATLADPPTGP